MLRLLAWNLHAGHGGRAADQAAAITAAEADVVLLFEAVSGPGHAEVLARGWPHAVFVRARARLGGGAQGSLLLSRLPILGWTGHDISNHPFERRIAVHAVLANGLHLIGVHLDLSGLGRRRQFRRLVAILERDVPGDAPLVLAGDCNDWSHGLDRLLAGHGFHEAHRVVHGRTARTWPARLPLLALDRIYLRRCRARDAGLLAAQGCSDHHGLLATILGPASEEASVQRR